MKNETIKRLIPDDTTPAFCGDIVTFEVPAARIANVVGRLYHVEQLPLKLITATDERSSLGCCRIWYIFGLPGEKAYVIAFIRVQDTTAFPSVAPVMHEAWDYERRIQSFFGLTPVGHPDPRPIILHENWPADVFPLRKDFDLQTRPDTAQGTYRFHKVKGEGIYDVSVGPVHAGIIEPGYFKISVAGEMIVLFDPRLGFTHKGSEKLFEVLPLAEKVRLSEKISGDSSFAHSLAFCQALEKLSGVTVSQRARYVRVVCAELERLANHFGDIGAIMLDAGFNFGGAQGTRLREMIMRINERLSGSRFLRGMNVVGGTTKDITAEEIAGLPDELADIADDFSEIIDVAQTSASLLNRLKGTGVLSEKTARDRGVSGIAAKALGIPSDVRSDFPYAAYDELPLERIETEQDGDVYARFEVRVKEVFASIKLIQSALNHIPHEQIILPATITFAANAVAVSCVEGWRGEIVYFVTTDAAGNITRVAPRDPSFINWALLRNATFDNIIPDFPLINKSFNLSYSGNDL